MTFAYETNGRLTVTAEMPAVQTQVTMVVERATGLSDDEFEKWRQWIGAGCVLEAREEAKRPEAAASQPVLELAADDDVEGETYDEPIPADEPLLVDELPPLTLVPPRRKAAAPKRPPPLPEADSGLDDFFRELG